MGGLAPGGGSAPGRDHDRAVADEEDPQDPFRIGEDPGWRRRTDPDRPDGLVALRQLFLAVVVGLVTVGVAVALLASRRARPDGWSWAALAAVVAVGGLSLAAVRWLPVSLDGADELALARSWRSRFFARLAASMTAALAGFVAFTATGVAALYPVGLVFAAVGLAVSGPLRANLIRDQERLARSGCPIPLIPALRRPVTPETR